MALDPSLTLRKWNVPGGAPSLALSNECAWRRLSDVFRRRPWGVRLAGGTLVTIDGRREPAGTVADTWQPRFGDKWLVFSADSSSEKLDECVRMLDSGGGNVYAMLESVGVHVLSGSAPASLSGGSFCDSSLEQQIDQLNVVKSITLRDVNCQPDADLKLRREHEYLVTLPKRAASLFVEVVDKRETEESFAYASRFEHSYTLAERLFQGTITRSAASAGLESLLLQLRDRVYGTAHVGGTWSCQEPDVLARIKRRNQLIIERSDEESLLWTSLLSAEQLTINGTVYFGWPTIENWLIEAYPILRPAQLPAELCHGDLIFDDILTPAGKTEWRLLDPNGDATSRMYDLGKLTLSLMSGYEFFKYNRYVCELNKGRSGVREISLACHDSDAASEYAALASEFPSLLSRTKVLPGGLIVDGLTLLFLNGLHNASLPYFHLVHHKDFQRALAFFAISIVRLNQVRSTLAAGGTISIPAAIERCLLGGFVN